MMKKSRKILAISIIIVIVIVIGVLILVSSALFGNPISKLIAKKQVKDYIDVVYSDSSINKSSYNLVSESYVFECTIEGEQRSITYKDKKIRDEYVESYYIDKFTKDFAEIKLDNMNANAVIDTRIIADGEYSTDFDKLNIETNMMLFIENISPDISAKDSKEAAATVTGQVLDALNDQYNIRDIYVDYNDTFGKYIIEMQDEEITFDKLLENTQFFKQSTTVE